MAILRIFDECCENHSSMAFLSVRNFLARVFGTRWKQSDVMLDRLAQSLIDECGDNGLVHRIQFETYLRRHPEELRVYAEAYRKNILKTTRKYESKALITMNSLSSIGWDPQEDEDGGRQSAEPSVSADSTDLYSIQVRGSTGDFDDIITPGGVEVPQDQLKSDMDNSSSVMMISEADSVDLQELDAEMQKEMQLFLQDSRRKSLLTESQTWNDSELDKHEVELQTEFVRLKDATSDQSTTFTTPGLVEPIYGDTPGKINDEFRKRIKSAASQYYSTTNGDWETPGGQWALPEDFKDLEKYIKQDLRWRKTRTLKSKENMLADVRKDQLPDDWQNMENWEEAFELLQNHFTLRKQMLKQFYPLRPCYKKLAWIIALLLIGGCLFLVVVFGMQFDLKHSLEIDAAERAAFEATCPSAQDFTDKINNLYSDYETKHWSQEVIGWDFGESMSTTNRWLFANVIALIQALLISEPFILWFKCFVLIFVFECIEQCEVFWLVYVCGCCLNPASLELKKSSSLNKGSMRSGRSNSFARDLKRDFWGLSSMFQLKDIDELSECSDSDTPLAEDDDMPRMDKFISQKNLREV